MDRMSAWDSPALGEDWFGKRNQKPRGSSPEDYGARAPGDKTPRGSSPEDYGAIASLMPDDDDPPRQTGESEVKPGKPQGDPGQPSTYEGEGNYKYQVAPDGRIYILQSGYKGQIRDYTSAPREVKKGTGAYNAIVAELNQKHQLGLKPAPVASRPAAPPASPPAPGDKNAKPQDDAKPAETPPAASVTSRKPPPIPATSAPGQGGMEPGQTQEWMSKLQQAQGIARSLYGEEAGNRWIEQYTVKHGAYLPQVNEMLSILQREQGGAGAAGTPPSAPTVARQPVAPPAPPVTQPEQDADPIAAYLLDRPEVNDYLQSFGVKDGGTYPERASSSSPELLFYQQHPEQFQNARSAIARTGRTSPQSVEDLAAMLSDPAVKQAIKSEIVRRGYGNIYTQ